jgi:hypothetical protein
MRNEIDSWLKGGCNYLLGVALYARYGKDEFLKRIFSQSDKSFNRQKLNQVLVALRDSEALSLNPSPAERDFEVNISKKVTEKKPPVEFPELLQVKNLRNQTMAELRSLHPYLSTLPEGEELRQLAVNIVKLRKKNVEHWQRYNHLLENGPDKVAYKPEPVMVPIELINTCENLRKSIGKAEQRLKEQTPPSQKTIDLIKEKKAQFELVKSQIAAYKGVAK